MKHTHISIVIFLVVAYSFLMHHRKKQDPLHNNGSESFPVPKEKRQYHRCVSQKIPYISQPLETAQLLLHTNKSFIRFGDSELLLMTGGSEPFQAYDSALAQKLSEAFADDDSNLMIGLYDTFSGYPLWRKGYTDWWLDTQFKYRQWILNHALFDRQYFSAMLTSTYIHTYQTNCILLPLLYQTMREIWRDKDVVLVKGDNKQIFQYDIYDTAKTQTIYLTPRYQAWKEYSSLKQRLMKEDPRKLFILTAGPVARVLSYDLCKAGRRALDLGHLAKDYSLFMEKKNPDVVDFFERYETQHSVGVSK